MKVKIERLDDLGRGIAYVNNKITFIKNALPGEIVKIKINKSLKKYNIGEVTKYIETSPNRITPVCKYYNECGGCDLMHLSYKEELSYKQEKVKNILKKYAGIEVNPDIISSDKTLNYRNKITLHYNSNKLGYFKENTNEIIEIDECLVVMNEINEYIKSNNIKEDIIIRENNKKEIVTSIDNNTMTEEINNLKFVVDASSFFQVNHYICSKIFDLLEENIDNSNYCLDLYSGVGTLSIVASKKAHFVYSIEVNPYSHKNALINKKLNNINNIEFILGKVEDKIKDIKENIDLIITDPPRSGMDKTVVNVINKLLPKKIIYISCDPITLARDLKLLDNYKLTKITLLDMFPNTHHIESFCVLDKLKVE